MVSFFLSAILLFTAHVCVEGGDNVAGWHARYVKDMEDGLKCNKGFVGLSPTIKEAADKCKNEHIASYLCFVTCVYHNFGYIASEKDLDFGSADLVTMESFDMKTKEGRSSYFRIALRRYECGKYYTTIGDDKFAVTYDDAAKCLATKEFFKCSWRSLFCYEKDDQVHLDD